MFKNNLELRISLRQDLHTGQIFIYPLYQLIPDFQKIYSFWFDLFSRKNAYSFEVSLGFLLNYMVKFQFFGLKKFVMWFKLKEIVYNSVSCLP